MAKHFSKLSLRVLASLILTCIGLEYVSRHLLFVPEFDIVIAFVVAYLTLRFNAFVGGVFSIFGVVFLSSFHYWHEIELDLTGKIIFWIGMIGGILGLVAYYKHTIVKAERHQAGLTKIKLENQISEKVHELNALAELIPQIVWSTDKQGIINYMNQRWTEFSGQRVLPPVWEDVLHPNDLAVVAQSWQSALVNPVPYSIEVRMKGKDGAYTWFLSRGSPILNDAGQIEGWVGAFTDINDLKLATDEIRKSELRLQSMIDDSPFGMLILRKDGTVKKVNDAWIKLWSYPEQALGPLYNGFNFFEHEQPAIKLLTADAKRVFNEEKISSRETYFDPAVSGEPGRPRWVDINFLPIYSGEEVIEVILTYNDVTDRKLSEIAASENQRQLRQLTEALPQMVWTATVHGGVDYYNDRWVEYTGWEKENLIGWGWRSLVHPDDLDDFTARWTMSVMTGNNFDSNLRLKHGATGEYRWQLVRGLCLRDEDGRRLKWFGTTTDIQEERTKSNRLIEAEVRSRALISSSALTLWSADRLGKFTFNEGEGFALLGVQAGAWVGKSIYEVQSQRPQVIEAFEDALRGNTSKLILEIDIHKFECAFSPLKGPSGEIIGVVGAGLEISARSEASSEASIELEVANRKLTGALERESSAVVASQMKSTFLANMSHEIRTPINGVLGVTSLLLETELNSEQRSYARTVQSSADSLLHLVNDILDLSKAESGKIDLESIDFDVEHVFVDIERTLQYSAKSKNIQLSRHGSSGLPRSLRGDPSRLRQILMNLAGNAIKFTETGTVKIESQVQRDGVDDLTLRIEIVDTGIGLSAESIQRLFQDFTQADSTTSRRFGGTGLGLAITKRLVELMNGKIGVTSTIGEGSTFWVEIPFLKSQVKELQPIEDVIADISFESRDQNPALRVLLAEDNSVNQLIAVRMLEKMGHSVVVAGNGVEVLDALNTSTFDLILMDCQMPELDGYETTRLIRTSNAEAFAALPIIAMTANAMNGDREKCLDVGMNDYVSKPVKPKDLNAAIDRNSRLRAAG